MSEEVKIVITVETTEIEEEQVRHYLDFMKVQINRYSQGIMNYTIDKRESEVDAEFRKRLEQSKKAPLAEGAMTKISPKV